MGGSLRGAEVEGGRERRERASLCSSDVKATGCDRNVHKEHN